MKNQHVRPKLSLSCLTKDKSQMAQQQAKAYDVKPVTFPTTSHLAARKRQVSRGRRS